VSFLPLVENESLKLLRRRRPQLVLLVLTVFLAVASWAAYRQQEDRGRGTDDGDWRARVEQRIQENERRATRRRIFVGFSRLLRYEAVRLRHHLDRGINPDRQTGPLFARGFAALGSALLLPLLVTVLVADQVSSESTAGTIKMLLTRPVARWKIFASKVATMALYTSLLVAASALLSWLIGGFAFGWRGFGAPVLTGFRFSADGVELGNVRMAPLWLDTLAAYGLAWVSALATGAIAVTFSTLFRSTAASMGTMFALIASGTLLAQLGADWEPTKWLFVTNLPLAQIYSGVPPPVAGMTLGHSVAVLGAWAVAAIVVGALVFERRDVTA
jgi:ABC-2 type transport system permease protein